MSESDQESHRQDGGPNLSEYSDYGSNGSEPGIRAEIPCRPIALSSQRYLSEQILHNLRSQKPPDSIYVRAELI
jgi:hypothetical protein